MQTRICSLAAAFSLSLAAQASEPATLPPEFLFQGGLHTCAYILVAKDAQPDEFTISEVDFQLGGELRARMPDGSFSDAAAINPGGPISFRVPHAIQERLIRAEIDPQNKTLALFFPYTFHPGDTTKTPSQVLLGKTKKPFFEESDWDQYLAGEEVKMFVRSRDFNLDLLFALTLSSVSQIRSNALGPSLNFDFTGLYQFNTDGTFRIDPPSNLPEGFRVAPKNGSASVSLLVQRGKQMKLNIGPVLARVEYENVELLSQRKTNQFKGQKFEEYVNQPDELFQKTIDVSEWNSSDIKSFLLFLRYHEAQIHVDQKSGGGAGFMIMRLAGGSPEVTNDWYVTQSGVKNSDYEWIVPFEDIKSIEIENINHFEERRDTASADLFRSRLQAGRVQVGDVFSMDVLEKDQTIALLGLLQRTGARVEVTFKMKELLLGPPIFEGTVNNISAEEDPIVSFETESAFGRETLEKLPVSEILKLEVLPEAL